MDLSNLNMENIGSILSSLSDDDMDSLKSMAQNFMGTSQSNESPIDDTQSETQGDDTSSAMNFGLDIESIAKITSIMGKLSTKKKDPRSDLLMALRPLLSEPRKSKVDQATKIIQLLEVLPLLKDMG